MPVANRDHPRDETLGSETLAMTPPAILRRLIPDPFILALMFTLLLATILPARGQAAVMVGWLSTAAVVLLFFFHGAKLARETVFAALLHWRLHAVIVGSTFVMFPLMALALSRALPGVMPQPLWIGILFLAALPSTVQSSIAFVSMARGNVPAAIASASASQMLGVLLTPPLISLMAGAHGAQVSFGQIGSVMMLILAPFVAGHLLRPWIGGWVQRCKSTIAITDRATILIAVYSAFSAAVIEGVWSRVPPATIGILVGVCAVMLAIALVFTFFAGRLLGFNREDEITILFCGTKKSLVQGVPMARVLFAGPDLGLILLPVMVFHQMQLMVCAWIARRYAERKDDV
jgi:sodium/bile acid cotransporter 7